MGLLFALCLAVGLGACAGLRAFLPIFLLGLAVRMQFPFAPHGTEEGLFLASDLALIIFGVLAALECLLDLVPVVDHAMHVTYFGIRPLAGAFVALSVLDDPGWFWFALVISILIGALVSLPVHTTSATVRVVSTATTVGTVNPVLSVKETILSLFGVFAFMVLAPVALLGAAAGAFLLLRWLNQKRLQRRDYVPASTY